MEELLSQLKLLQKRDTLKRALEEEYNNIVDRLLTEKKQRLIELEKILYQPSPPQPINLFYNIVNYRSDINNNIDIIQPLSSFGTILTNSKTEPLNGNVITVNNNSNINANNNHNKSVCKQQSINQPHNATRSNQKYSSKTPTNNIQINIENNTNSVQTSTKRLKNYHYEGINHSL